MLAVLQKSFSLQLSDASRHTFLGHIDHQMRFLVITLRLQPRRETQEFAVGLLILHLVDPTAAFVIHLHNFLVRLGPVLAETQVVRSFRSSA